MGRYEAPPQPYVYGFRGRMDERYDLVRSVRDRRYVYLRNYMPHRIYGQHVAYMFETPTTQVWKRLFDDGKLSPPRTYFWKTKPAEELYDLENDPDEVNNLAGRPQYREILRAAPKCAAGTGGQNPRRRFLAGRRNPHSVGRLDALRDGARPAALSSRSHPGGSRSRILAAP